MSVSINNHSSEEADEYIERTKYLFNEWKRYYDLCHGKSEDDEWIELC